MLLNRRSDITLEAFERVAWQREPVEIGADEKNAAAHAVEPDEIGSAAEPVHMDAAVVPPGVAVRRPAEARGAKHRRFATSSAAGCTVGRAAPAPRWATRMH